MEQEPKKIDERLGNETLFTFIDVYGNEQHEVVEKVDKLVKVINEVFPDGALVSVVGSSFQGHALPKIKGDFFDPRNSDIDVMVYYNELDCDRLLNSSIRYDVLPKFEKDEGVSLDLIREIYLDEIDDPLAIIYSPNIYLSGIVYPTFGNVDLINNIIEKVRSVIGELSEEQKKVWLDRFSIGMVNDLFHRKPLKRRGINPDLEENAQVYRENKLRLFRDRIYGLFIK